MLRTPLSPASQMAVRQQPLGQVLRNALVLTGQLPGSRPTGSNPFSSATRPAGGDSSAVPSLPPISDPARPESPLIPGEHVLRRDVPDGAVQSLGLVSQLFYRLLPSVEP